ncbi:STAS domain-containing protein [Streptomyces sp. NPDC002138]|uniref:STAS domain-containing protein n=1 Tax=Streptomyces sp. NPDC002138 TaxID=3154410 RepID=UPI0033222CA7
MAATPPRDADGHGIAVEVLAHSVVVRPVGEIDLDTAPALRLALTEALAHASPARPVVVDCGRVTFCDSSALNTLIAARRTAQESGAAVRLTDLNPQLLRLLEMTGVLSLFVAAEPTG